MKKHISLLLVLCMLFTILPMGMTVVSATTTTVTESVSNETATNENAIAISTLQSEITLTFGSAVADASAITFTKADDSAVKGAVVPTLAEDGLTYTLEFGRLENNTQYKLTVPASITGGDAVTFTYLATEPGYDLNTDMSDVTYDETTLNPTDTRLTYGVAATNYFVKTEGDNKYIEVNPQEVPTANSRYYLQISPKLHGSTYTNYNKLLDSKRDVYIVETAVKAYAKDSSVSGNREGVNKLYMYDYGNKVTPFVWSDDSNPQVTVGGVTSTITSDSNGWYHVKAVLREDGRAATSGITPDPTADQTRELQYLDVYDVSGDTESYLGEAPATTMAYNATLFDLAGIYVAKNANATNESMAFDYVRARKDKAMTVLKTDGYTSASKQVVFHMSDGINAATLDTITVTDEEGVAVEGFTTAADNDNRTITVGFPEGIETEGTYTVDISKVFGTNGVAVYNNEYYIQETEGVKTYVNRELAKRTFTVGQEGEEITPTTVTESVSNATATNASAIAISTLQSEITLTFGSAVADASAITFKKVVGGAEVDIKGAVVPTLAEDGLAYTLEFGRLEDATTYKLTVPASVTGGEAVTFTYLATENGYDLNTDMSDVTYDGTTLNPTDTRLTYGVAATNYFVKTEGDNKYIEVNPQAVVTTGVSRYFLQISPKLHGSTYTNYNKLLNSKRDVYIVETAVKAYVKDSSVSGNRDGVNKLYMYDYGSKVTPFVWADDSNPQVTVGGVTSTITPDSNGWYHVKAVLREDGRAATSGITPDPTADQTRELQYLDVYDVSGDTESYLGEAPATTMAYNATAFNLAGIHVAKNANATNESMAFDYVRARKDKAMKVLKTDGYTAASKQVVFHMSDGINAATLNTITVTDEEGVAVEGFTAAADNDNRTITVAFPGGLIEGTYTIDISKVIGTNGVAVYNNEYYIQETEGVKTYVNRELAKATFTVEEADSAAYITDVAFKGSVGDGALLNLVGGDAGEGEIAIGEVDTIQVTAKIGGINTAVAFLAIYDSENNLIKVVQASQDGKVYTATADGLTKDSTKHARLFVWRDIETIEPLFEPLECL